MSVNGIELAVGQVWMTRGGHAAEVAGRETDDLPGNYPWFVKVNTGHEEWVNDRGQVVNDRNPHPNDLAMLHKKAPKAETVVDALAAHGEKTADAVRAGVQILGGAADRLQSQATRRPLPVFTLNVGDEVTLASGAALIVTDLHGGHTDHRYQGVAAGTTDRIAFSDSEVLSFRNVGAAESAEKTFDHVLLKVADTAATLRASAGDAKTLEELVAATAELPVGLVEPAPSAPDILEAAAGHMRDRAATYDKPEGERSMAQTVAIFNLHHGTKLTEAQGWHFMQVLKDVRLFTNTANPHRDSIDDGVAYAALKGEALLQGGAQ